MMDMSVTAFVVVGLVLLVIVVAGLFIAFRVLGGRMQNNEPQAPRDRSRRRATKRSTR